MSNINELFAKKIKVINVGLQSFADNLTDAGFEAVNVNWKPPAGGDEKVLRQLGQVRALANKIEEANNEALNRVLEGEPTLIDMGLAKDVLPGLPDKTILHAGPPLTWAEMSGPVRGAVIGGILFEGWADSAEKAEKLAASGEIGFAPCHHYQAVGPMAGILPPSMPVFIVENKKFGNRAFSSMNEGLGKVLRFGAYNEEVLTRLRWMKETLYPVLRDAIRATGGIDLKNLTAQALQMGDECHNRNKAASALFLRDMVPFLTNLDYPKETLEEVVKFIGGNEHFYLNISMASAKSILDAASGIEYSTMVTAMSRNGTNFGIRVSGLGDRWFTAPALAIDGLYFPGYGPEDANPDLGDSTITETSGIGGFAMASAPAIVKFVGGNSEDAFNYTREMYKVTLGENSSYAMPNLNFRGTPTGIDILKVLEMDVLPVINTGIAHKDAGVGQIGAGVVNPPVSCFTQALTAFCEQYLEKE